MKNFVQEGAIVDHVAASAITSGDVVLIGPLVGVAVTDIANGETGSVAIEGVFDIAKNTSTVMAVGSTPRWDVSATEISTAAAASGDVGGAFVVVKAALSADATVNVKLTPNGSATIT
ncbi:MAG: DUF2190 family protein [Flavobacteriales bacterium]|nr:DUF2190 family protein [Flavobacteriales bacterium]